MGNVIIVMLWFKILYGEHFMFETVHKQIPEETSMFHFTF